MSICQTCTKTNNSMATTLCGHIFCTSCLITFALKHNSSLCPICDTCMIISKDSNVIQPLRKVIICPPTSTFPIAQKLKNCKIEQKSIVKKSKPVPRIPNESASDFEKKIYERKLIKSDFNNKKITLIKHDESDFLLSEYHKIASEFNVDPRIYVKCDEFSFENPDVDGVSVAPTIVLIPKFKEITIV